MTGNQLVLPGLVTETSWAPPERFSFDDWANIGARMLDAHTSVNWWIGDWALHGMSKDRQWVTEREAAAIAGRDIAALAKCVAVAERFPVDVRRTGKGASWSHHAAVAKLPLEQSLELLDRSQSETWLVTDIAAAVREAAQPDPLPGTEPDPPTVRWVLTVEVDSTYGQDDIGELLETLGEHITDEIPGATCKVTGP